VANMVISYNLVIIVALNAIKCPYVRVKIEKQN
jgi:hypothetical protein